MEKIKLVLNEKELMIMKDSLALYYTSLLTHSNVSQSKIEDAFNLWNKIREVNKNE